MINRRALIILVASPALSKPATRVVYVVSNTIDTVVDNIFDTIGLATNTKELAEKLTEGIYKVFEVTIREIKK